MDEEEDAGAYNGTHPRRFRARDRGLSCMLNTEISAILASIRRVPPEHQGSQLLMSQSDDRYDTHAVQSIKSLRPLIFNPPQEWRTVDPSVYLVPFLDVVQSDDITATATLVALQSVLKILRLHFFDEKTPGARDAINAAVIAVTGCRLEKTDHVTEDSVLIKVLQVLVAVMDHPASVFLTDNAVCTAVNTCFHVVQTTHRGGSMNKNARNIMQEMIQIVFSRLPDIESADSDTEDADIGGSYGIGYGVRCTVDIFHLMCNLLNVAEVGVENTSDDMHTENIAPDEDMQLFGLVMINYAIELGGEAIRYHPKLVRMVQDDLCHHLVHYGMRSKPLVLSVISSTILNIYHFLRRSIRLQLEAFFFFVLFRVARMGSLVLQEVAVEAIINFVRQPTFIFEAYANYDCDPIRCNVFEEIGKLLCRQATPHVPPTAPQTTVAAAHVNFTSLHTQALEGVLLLIHTIADSISKDDPPSSFEPYPVQITDFSPYWEEKAKNDDEMDEWVEHVRIRKAQKKKLRIAANIFNREEKKGLDYLKAAGLISEPPDPKAYAYFFRYMPGLDKNMIGDYLGDPGAFHLQVLKDFTDTFHFPGVILDTALRTYLETFRLPGEAQKIQRILEAFSDRFYDQQSLELFVSKDAVYILCYSLIMLNTDQHNPQVKKKMTEEEFIRNNRGINGGQDLPREYLSQLFRSISSHPISIFTQTGLPTEMNPSKWVQLICQSKIAEPFVPCEIFDGKLSRDMFAAISGPSVALLSVIFVRTNEHEILNDCIEGFFSVVKVAQHGLYDTMDEVVACFYKATRLLSPQEIDLASVHDLRKRLATLALFTVANDYGHSIRGGWRDIVEYLVFLKRQKLIPQILDEPDAASAELESHPRFGSSTLHNPYERTLGNRASSSMIGRFSHFLSMETVEDSLSLDGEYEQIQKMIQQCRIGNIFKNSSSLPEESLLCLGRALIFAAGGKAHKFTTSVEEEDTVGFCWELLLSLTSVNIDRFPSFWPPFQDFLLQVAQFPLFSPMPFAEKAIVSLMKICLKLLSSYREEKNSEETIFKTINLMWKLDKEILDICGEVITQTVSKILVEYPGNLQTQLGWKSVLHLLSVTGRHPETYAQGVEALITLMSEKTYITKYNYAYCIDCAFGFVALKNSPIEKNVKILDLMSNSVNLLVQWNKNYSDPGSSFSMPSNASSSSFDDNPKALGGSSLAMNLFVKLGEALRKTSLARREEVRNQAVAALHKSFILAQELEMQSTNCIGSFNLVIFAMVDDLHEKMLEYSRRENAEREMRSMEGTLKIAMELLTDVFLQYVKQIAENPGFRTFWLGVLRRMDTCMKADLGAYGEASLQEMVPGLLRKIITTLKENEILVKVEGDDLWEITYIQIQWIAPALKEELFPDEEL
uniref:SEC7 domain-containing protein n=1 Tax=Kalanchoe fedtschenkoi TaxID=63787 RepID=A0A7N0ZT61_KALFE